ncbi:MAG: S-layer homology domain-containing protein [Synechococcales cyanobacterium RM1_1_8]|nr:S-layer homology domain-containing protein [Synechococcales cyanobacterium RM1_1_8]
MVKAYPNAPTVRPAPQFTDVPAGHWARSAIQTAAQRGFLVGYPNRQFKPNQLLNKAQAIAVLANAQKLNPAIEINDTLTRYFEDQAAIPEFARGAIAAATEANLIVSHPNPRQLRAERRSPEAKLRPSSVKPEPTA